MKYTQAKSGRVFVIRLHQGDIVHECIEQVARQENVHAGTVCLVGGADTGSKLVVGPEDGSARPVVPMTTQLDGAHEVAGVGTLFPNEDGEPVLHMHLAAGRGRETITGCVRAGVVCWTVLEAVLQEITDTTATRVTDPDTGFELLQP